MSSRSIVFVIGIVLLLGGVGTVLAVMLRHEPDFYQRYAMPPSQERKIQAGQFLSEFGQFFDKIQHEEKEWDAQFNEKCINSYFEESFVQSGVAERILPRGVSQPRVCVEADRIRLAFRYGTPPWSTVISIALRVWVPAKERNVIALELQGMQAGSLPISAQSLLDRVTEMARPNNIEVTWYRLNANPVALLRFQADRIRPTLHLQQLELHPGLIWIKGRSAEGTPLVSSPTSSPNK